MLATVSLEMREGASDAATSFKVCLPACRLPVLASLVLHASRYTSFAVTGLCSISTVDCVYGPLADSRWPFL